MRKIGRKSCCLPLIVKSFQNSASTYIITNTDKAFLLKEAQLRLHIQKWKRESKYEDFISGKNLSRTRDAPFGA